jgi:hypothetical protein
MRTRSVQNGYRECIVVAEIDPDGRKDYVPAGNWQELQDAARAYLASRGIEINEAGIFDCPEQLAEQARFGFELFWAQSGLALGAALAAWRRKVLGASDYASFALQHDVSHRVVQLLEKLNRVPRRADARKRLERAYRLPEGFLDELAREQHRTVVVF